MPNLSEILADTNQRVSALENEQLDEAAGIARITKLYGNIKITCTVTASIHQYNLCSTSTICSETLIL